MSDRRPFGVRGFWSSGSIRLLAACAAVCLAGAASTGAQNTVSAGSVGEAQIAPDGRSVAFTRVVRRGGVANLWRIPFAGGQPEALTTAATEDSRPRWSPDGSMLAFLSRSGGEGSPRRLAVWPSDSVLFGDASTDVMSCEWSAGGRSLACIARRKGSQQAIATPTLFVVDVASRTGEELKSLSRSTVVAFDWSPSGNALAAIVSESSGAARVVATTPSGDARQVAPVAGLPTRVAWSRDGATIAWLGPSSGPGGESHVFTVSANGGAVREYAMRAGEAVRELSWRTDGRLALSLRWGSDSWIDILDPVPNVRTSVLPTGEIQIVGEPSWAADGSRYAVVGSGSDHGAEVFAGSLPPSVPREPDSVGAPPTPVRRITFFANRP